MWVKDILKYAKDTCLCCDKVFNSKTMVKEFIYHYGGLLLNEKYEFFEAAFAFLTADFVYLLHRGGNYDYAHKPRNKLAYWLLQRIINDVNHLLRISFNCFVNESRIMKYLKKCHPIDSYNWRSLDRDVILQSIYETIMRKPPTRIYISLYRLIAFLPTTNYNERPSECIATAAHTCTSIAADAILHFYICTLLYLHVAPTRSRTSPI